MNLTTVLVTLVIAGSATPGISKMALQPVIAQKRATNFGIAETQAVTFAAKNEGKISLAKTPDQCNLQDMGNDAYTITCWEGKRTFKMSATRAFRQGISSGGQHTTNGNQSSGEEISNEEYYKANDNYYSGDGSSNEEKHTANDHQSSGDGRSNEEKHTDNHYQSSGDGRSNEEKYTANHHQSSRDGRSNEEKYTANHHQSSRDGRPNDAKEKYHYEYRSHQESRQDPRRD